MNLPTSGAPWLEKLPQHWARKPISACFFERNQKNHAGSDTALLSLSYGQVIQKDIESNSGLRPDSYDTYQTLHRGNLVLRLLDLQNDKKSIRVGQVQETGIITSAYVGLDCESWHSDRYAYYVMLMLDILKVFYGLGSGMRQSITFNDLGRIPIGIPPDQEQVDIAAYLDAETARIDLLIEEKKRLIPILDELRSRAIYEAVFSDEPGWSRSRLKFVAKNIIDTEHKTVPYHENGKFLVARTTNIKFGRLVMDGAKFTDQEGFEAWTKRAVPQAGDILFTREAPAGEACLVPEDIPLCVGQRTVLLQVELSKAIPKFVLWSLYGGLSTQFIADLSRGSTVPHFNMPDIGDIPLCIGPIDEQASRVEKLEVEIARIDDLKNHVGKEIAMLIELRSSSITDCVLGRIDVRDHSVKK